MTITSDRSLEVLIPQLASVNDALQFLLMFLKELLEAIESDRPVDLDELVHVNRQLAQILAETTLLETNLVKASPCQIAKTVM